jgi:hypothetical protein
MKPKPTGIHIFLLEAIFLGMLACTDPLPPTVPTGSTQTTENSCPLAVAEFGSPCQSPMAPPVIGRVWVDRDGRVIGFFFATSGCDLCENRNGTVTVFLSPADGPDSMEGEDAAFGSEKGRSDFPVAAIVLPKEEGLADGPLVRKVLDPITTDY